MSPKKPKIVRPPRVRVRPAVAFAVRATVAAPVLAAPVLAAPVLAAPVLAAPKAEAKALVREIGVRREHIAEDFYEIGVALERLSRPRLYRALGFATFDDLLKRRRVMSRMQAMKLIVVAEAYPMKMALMKQTGSRGTEVPLASCSRHYPSSSPSDRSGWVASQARAAVSRCQ